MATEAALDAPTLGLAVSIIAGRCDYAHTLDGRGFNAYDAEFGHRLAEQAETAWTPKMRWAAWKMLRKYRVQLNGAGLAFDSIPVPPNPYDMPEHVAGPTPALPGAPVVSAYRVDHSGDDFILHSPYNPVLVEALRALPRRRWDGQRRAWFIADCDENREPLDALLTRFRFVRSDAASAKLAGALAASQARRDAEAALEAASKAADADVAIDRLGGVLRPFQRAGVAYASQVRRTFIADEQGLGKTAEALATLEHLGSFPALVVSPATLKPNWLREAATWLPHRSIVSLGRQADLFALHAEIVLITYDALGKYRDFLHGRPWKAVVCDESHSLKSPRALRTRAVQELVDVVKPEVRLLLTGTPFVNAPAEGISQLQILDQLDALGGLAEYRNRYVYGMRLQELNDRLRKTCFLRRLKADVMAELPPKVYAMQTLPLTNRQEYAAAEKDVIAWVQARAEQDRAFLDLLNTLDDDARKAAIKEHAADAGRRAERAEALVRINALKYLAAKGKLAAAIQWVSDFLDNGQKLVFFADHVELQQAVIKAFPGCAHVLGDDKPEERQRQVDRFQTDPACLLIVCSLKVAGVGITLTAASDVAMLELGWTPAGIDQATDRCHRIGQTDSVTAWMLLAEDSIDEWLSDLIDKKRRVVSAATDGTEVEEASLLAELMAKLRSKAA